MDLWNEARVALYGALQRRLPVGVRNWIGGSALTARLRKLLLRPDGIDRLVVTDVSFEGHHFKFAAPVKVAATVRRVGGIENRLCRLILKECRAGDVAIDVGTNYGFVTLVMAQAVGTAGAVHSFEANPEIYEGARSNLERNSLTGYCTLVQGFVAETSGGDRIAVDDYVERERIKRVDFIKVDVDGPDLQVLEGARSTLQRFHPIVVIEMTGEQAKIVALLEGLGYQCTDMHGNDLVPGQWPENMLAAVGRRLAVPMRRS
jgi:precorrin-6B methylase 2